jgi:hypothetical protein
MCRGIHLSICKKQDRDQRLKDLKALKAADIEEQRS